jgi:hypothetical protein
MTILTTPTAASGTARLQLWVGRSLTVLFALFMVVDSGSKLVKLDVVADALIRLGFSTHLGFSIGVLQAVLLALYFFARISVLGAVLLARLFGGAFAAPFRIGSPFVTHDMFGVCLGVLSGGLWLRDARVRVFFPVQGRGWV